jgi:hypothetical protein
MSLFEPIIWGLSVAGVASLAGYFLVKTLVKSGIEKAVEHSFNKRLEEDKTALKKSEVYFSLQLEALSRLRRILREMIPRKTHPDMDWHEACEVIAEGFSSHEKALSEFLWKYEAVLPKEVAKDVQSCLVRASEGTFQFVWNPERGYAQPTREATKTADKLHDALGDAIKRLQEHVDAQVGVE